MKKCSVNSTKTYSHISKFPFKSFKMKITHTKKNQIKN